MGSVKMQVAYDRDGSRDFIVAISENCRSWDDGSCDALTVSVLARAESTAPTLWVRTRMFSDHIFYGAVEDAVWPPPGSMGEVNIVFSRTSAFGYWVSVQFFGAEERTFRIRR